MSLPIADGRDRRQNISRFRGGEHSDGVTVKTLSNSYSQAQSYPKRVQTNGPRDDNYRAKREAVPDYGKHFPIKSIAGKNDDHSYRPGSAQQQYSPSSSSASSRTSVSSQKYSSSGANISGNGNTPIGKGKESVGSAGERYSDVNLDGSKPKLSTSSGIKGTRSSANSDRHMAHQDVEVRTHSNGRNSSGRSIPSFSRQRSEGAHQYSSTAGRPPAHLQKSNARRVYNNSSSTTSDKYRVKNELADYLKGTIHDGVLCKLLSNVTRDDSSHAITQLQTYLMSSSNSHVIQRCEQNLWDAIIKLYSVQEKTSPNEFVKKSLVICLARTGLTSMDSMSHFRDRFFRWLFELYEGSEYDMRIWLMFVVYESLQNIDVKVPHKIQYLTEQLYHVLDTSETSGELFAVLRVITFLAEKNRAIITPMFTDISDILTGWSVGPEQTDDVIYRISQILISFHSFWVADMGTCRRLTGNFVEDIEYHTKELCKLELSSDKVAYYFSKMNLLARAFQTFVKAAGRSFSHEVDRNIEYGFVSSSVFKMIKYINELTDANVWSGLSLLKLEVTDCIGTLTTCGEDLSTVTNLLHFMIDQANSLLKDQNKSTIKRLSVLNKLVLTCDAAKVIALTRHILDMDLTPLKLNDDIQIQAATLQLHQNWFATKDMQTIQITFRKTKEYLEASLAVLSGDGEILWSGSQADIVRNKKKAQELLLFHLSSLTQAATDTNNLILMYAVEPSMFDFLLKDMLLAHGDSLKAHSTVLIQIVRLLHLHCDSNKNFIAKSNLCAADTTRRHRHNITVNITSGDNFSMILESMGELFSLMRQNTKGLVLLTRWISEIVEQLSYLNPPLLNNILVVTMVTNLLSLGDDVMVESMLLNIAKTLSCLTKHAMLSPALLTLIVDYTLYQLSSELSTVREQFLQIITLLPVDSFQRVNSKELMRKHNQVLGLRRAVMSGRYGTLGVEQFRSVASVLLKQYTDSEEIDSEWIQRLLLTADKPPPISAELDRSVFVIDQIIHHEGLLEYWLLWQAADFCVAHRLRTPIGKPLETFMCIEAAIKQIDKDTKIETMPKCGADTKRVWVLLQFMENLEKALYNAYEGTAGSITTHGKMVRTFFRTNRGTCIEWLTRIRLPLVRIASAYGHPATVIRHGYELITDMLRCQSTQTPEFDIVITHLIEAWCQLNCPEAVQGLYEWCKSVCNRKLSWIKPFFLKAMGRYEQAATELKTSLSNMLTPQALGDSIKLQTRSSSAGDAVNQLTAQQITDCYTSLQSWDDACNWLNEFEQIKLKNIAVLNGVDPARYCDRVVLADYKDKVRPELISWSKRQHLTEIWSNAIKTVDMDHCSLLTAEDNIELNKLVRIECSSDWPSFIQPHTMLLLQSQKMNESALKLDDLSNITSQSYGLSWLLKLFQISSSQTATDYSQKVLIACCREARRTENPTLANDLMSKLSLVQRDADTSPLNLRIAREAAKQVFSCGKSDPALEKMITISLQPLGQETDKEVSELVARSTLTVVKWLQNDSHHLQTLSSSDNMESVPALAKLITECHGYLIETPTVPLSDKILGSILQRSTEQCPLLAKTWHQFGNWAYKWGRKCLDNAEQQLTQEEIEKIESFVPTDLTREEREDILAVMSMVQGTFSATDEDLADDSPDYGDDDLQEIRRRLISCCPALSDEAIDNLLDFWTVTAKRVYTLYEESAKAYFSYLSLCVNSQGSDYHNVTVTLRLLRLLVKHAWELREVLESELATTPTAPWRSIIPQLFSRLNHPELYVRQSVSELLARLADDYPHLIVYPAIVGCNQSALQLEKAFSDMETPSENEVETVEADGGVKATDSSSGLTDCFQQLVDTLSSDNELLIKQVSTLVNELCRITVLWDELWLGSLSQLNATAAERIKALASEVERVKNNISLTASDRKLLIHEKRDTIVKPLIHTIERLSDITGKAPETKHEQWFQETYSHLIEKGLQRLKNPEKDEDLVSDWQPFKQLHLALQQRSQKRSSHMLKMKDLSSVLASLTDTHIPLPGAIAKSDKQPITLQSVHSTVQILPTKTKPKKLAFLGSDGQKYTYLFKGLEDLHLDERIMQLLNIVNDMLVSKGLTDNDCALYRARNYSVTPLGLRSGLIMWVDGCVPLFSLYKRWQVREAAAQSKPNGGNSTVQRPSEVLYSKLLPLLKPLLEDRGLDPKQVKVSDVEKIRKDWPQNALVTATKQLIAETPSHLVAKEIWCHSTSSNEWWNMTQTYCRSVAVMSAIGYILGLGDRHLDNLLLDLNNGEIVHIDYNVCFDKGKSLRVPERVPFRLTNNVVAAMGATGVEGIFRSAFEHTIKSMRLGKETLLTLLEAFVYDPLVDWTVGGETGLAGAFYGGNYAFGNAAKDYRRRKKQMERDITRSMFSIRVTEMKAAWLQNKDEMSSALNELVACLASFSEESTNITHSTEQLAQCKEMLKYIEELKKEGGQAVSRLTQRYASNLKLVTAKDECLKDVNGLSEEFVKYSKLHQTAIEAVTGPLLDTLEKEIYSIPALEEAPSSYARPFMQSVGQLTVLDQLEQQHDQLMRLIERRHFLMLHCKESLSSYGNIIGMFPAGLYASNHIMGDCMQLVARLQNDFTYTSCQAAARHLEVMTARSLSKSLCSKALNNERALQTLLNSDILKLEKLVERSEAEPANISELIRAYELKLQAINKYQKHHGENGHRSIMFIVLPKLAEITKKYLLMESTASKSEKRLHSLTSREGDWFLDDLACVSDNLLEYVYITDFKPLPTSDSGDVNTPEVCTLALQNIIAGVHKVYIGLQDMVLNFQQIILPDILMSLVKGDESVRVAINSLEDDVIKSHDLGKMCSKLGTMLRNIIFGTKEVDSHVVDAVNDLRRAYQGIVLHAQGSSNMCKGKMLTAAFNGLFDHVYEEYCAAMRGTDKLDIPKSWRKIDIIREAGALQLSQYNEKTKSILTDLFFVKQVMAMKEFYAIASHYVNIFSDADQVTIDSYEALSRPIKSFIADFVRKQILGVASQSAGFLICQHLSGIGLDVDKEIALKDFGATSRVSIEDLCRKGLDRKTQTGTQLSQANALISNFETAWRKQDLAKRLTRNRSLMEALIDQQKRYLLCYQWLHEDLLSSTPSQTTNSQQTRKEVLTELHKSLSALLSTSNMYSEHIEKLTTSEGTIAQRLKWAAGANPKLNLVLSKFENSQAVRTSIFQAQSTIVKDLNTYCHSLLHLETMRTKSQEASSLESKCRQLINRCLDVCKTLEEDEQITDQQRMMLSLMSKQDRQKTGNAFLGRAHDSVQSHISNLTSKIKGINRTVVVITEKYQSHVSALQYDTLNAHHKLISEVRAVLKTLAKEEMEEPEVLGCRVQNYLRDYKHFSERLANALKLASHEKLTPQLRLTITELVTELNVDIESIFTRLLDIAKPLIRPSLVELKPTTDKAAIEAEAHAYDALTSPEVEITATTSPSTSAPASNRACQGPGDKVQRDPKTGKAVQERNSYAVSVWRRVKMKLDGRELDPNKKMSVTDQVSYVIAEASDLKNLSQMYEGWTSWV